jgi:hypothetical protein
MSTDQERGEDLPPLLDFYDQLDDVEREADADVSDEVAAVREDLDRLAARDDEHDSLVDDVDDDVLALRERLSGDADWYAEAIQNRLQQYRSARDEASDTLVVADPELTVDGTAVDVARRRESLVELRGTLVDQGGGGDATVVLALYDDDGGSLRKVEISQHDVESGERRDLGETVYVPPGTAHYSVTALDAEDPRSIEGGAPTPEGARADAEDDGDGDAGERGRNEAGERSATENAGAHREES